MDKEFPSHPHPLNLIELLRKDEDEDEGKEETEENGNEDKDEESRLCGLCGKGVKGSCYECSKCNFNAHPACAKDPPLLLTEVSKIHEHTFTLLPRHVSFTCNACGLYGDKSPYVCLTCSLMIHKECLNLPRVIRISRHHHRIFHTLFLGPGTWSCGVCWQKIDGKYGAYSCRLRRDYAVHSRCATRKDIWDGEDLEGVPEEDDKIKEKEMLLFVSSDDDNKLIRHISHHEHLLKLGNKDGDVIVQPENVRCSGCVLPIASEPFYRCDNDCDFFLHEKCARLPSKKTTFLHRHTLTLCIEDDEEKLSCCGACHLLFNGFKYRCLECKDRVEFDVRCSSAPEPFKYGLHAHPLYSGIKGSSICSLCNQTEEAFLLSCVECKFSLCFACAYLPDEVSYKYDEHLLSHTFGKDVTNLYWCDLCERRIDGESNYYKCSDCGPVLHTECILGSFRNMMPGFCFITHGGDKFKVFLNDRTFPPICIHCYIRCHEPLFLMSTTIANTTDFWCSFRCVRTHLALT